MTIYLRCYNRNSTKRWWKDYKVFLN